LFVWSPIAPTAALKQEVDALGAVRCIISAIRLHHLFLGEWKFAYPQARLTVADVPRIDRDPVARE
jgi:hypothetical protein